MTRNISIVIGLAIIIVIIVLVAKKPSSTVVTTSQPSTVQVVNNTTPTKPSTTGTYTPPKSPVANPNTSYNTYINNLGNATNKCDVTAKDQFMRQYSTYEGGSYQINLNPKTGACYSRITGKSHVQYSASTTAHIIFQDVYANRIVAECSDSIGITYGNSEWTCVDRTSGARTISVDEFNSLIYNYATR